VTPLESRVALWHGDFAAQSERIDRVETRLERIERRLEIVPAYPFASAWRHGTIRAGGPRP
jgi:hypothetical protein